MNTQEKYKLLDKIEDIERVLVTLTKQLYDLRKQLEREI